jgi:hypothetical protein
MCAAKSTSHPWARKKPILQDHQMRITRQCLAGRDEIQPHLSFLTQGIEIVEIGQA